jgi:hypothetical protein
VRRRVRFTQLATGAVRERESRASAIGGGTARLLGGAHLPLRLSDALVGAPAEIIHPHRVPFPLGDTLVPDDDAPFLTGLEREDARTQHPMSHPFDQCRVLLPPHDLFVDLARLHGIHRLSRDHLAVDRQLEVSECGVLRQREDVVRLADRAAAVDEALLHFVAQHAIAQFDLDVAARPHHLRARGHALDHRPAWPGLRAAWNDDTLGRRNGGKGKGEDERKGSHEQSGC